MGNKSSRQQEDPPSGASSSQQRVFGEYKMVYLGSCPVNKSSGEDVVRDAGRRVMVARNPKRKVVIIITNKGISVREQKTDDELRFTPMNSFSYISILGRKHDYVAYIESNRAHDMRTCHVFQSKKHCKKIQPAVNQAFKAAAMDQNAATRSRTPSMASASLSASAAVKMETKEFQGRYLGHTTVNSTGGEATVKDGVAICRRVSRPVKVIFRLSGDVISIVGAKKPHQEITQILAGTITFTHTAKTILSMITQDAKDICFCHAFRLKNKKEAKDCEEAVGAALVQVANQTKYLHDGANATQQATAFARHLTHTHLSKSSPTRNTSDAKPRKRGPLGLFEAKYLGSVPIERNGGQEACNVAAESLLMTKPAETVVAISVSSDGIKVVEALTSEIVSNVFIKNIAFTSVVTDKKILKRDKSKGVNTDEALFVYIIKDERLDRLACEIFRAGPRVHELSSTINVAFQVAVEESKRMKKRNAFTAVSQKRDAVKGPLFKRQIHRRDLKPLKVLGMGQFGEVYLALQTVKAGTGENKGNTIHRAVKLLKDGAAPADREEFLRESELMLNFAHVNLVRLIGVAVQQRPWLCVLEYMEYGDLRAVVRAAKDKRIKITLLEQLKFCVQIATGMDYMAKQRFIHMDLAARNCLLSSKNLVKIADFGLSRKLPDNKEYYRLTTTLKLPIKWMAIESMDEKVFSPASDCWALGVTFWELAAYGDVPYPGVKNLEVQRQVRQGMRLDKPHNTGDEFYQLMRSCWEQSPKNRPTFDQLRKRILTLARKAREECPPLRDVGRLVKGGAKVANSASVVVPEQPPKQTPSPSRAGSAKRGVDLDFTEAGPKSEPVVGIPEEQYEKGLARFIQVKPSDDTGGKAEGVEAVDLDDVEEPSGVVTQDSNENATSSRPSTASNGGVVLNLLQDDDQEGGDESVLDDAEESLDAARKQKNQDNHDDGVDRVTEVADDADHDDSGDNEAEDDGDGDDVFDAEAAIEGSLQHHVDDANDSDGSSPALVNHVHKHDSGQGTSTQDSEEDGADESYPKPDEASPPETPLTHQPSFSEPDEGQSKAVDGGVHEAGDVGRTLDFSFAPPPSVAWGASQNGSSGLLY